jgi:hypothetical protein
VKDKPACGKLSNYPARHSDPSEEATENVAAKMMQPTKTAAGSVPHLNLPDVQERETDGEIEYISGTAPVSPTGTNPR